MNVFAVVKDNVTAKDVAMRYGIKINLHTGCLIPMKRTTSQPAPIDFYAISHSHIFSVTLSFTTVKTFITASYPSSSVFCFFTFGSTL